MTENQPIPPGFRAETDPTPHGLPSPLHLTALHGTTQSVTNHPSNDEYQHAREATMDGWTPKTGATRESAIYQALGAASICWEHLDNAGIFDSDRAKAIGDGLIEYLERRPVVPVAAHMPDLDEIERWSSDVPHVSALVVEVRRLRAELAAHRELVAEGSEAIAELQHTESDLAVAIREA